MWSETAFYQLNFLSKAQTHAYQYSTKFLYVDYAWSCLFCVFIGTCVCVLCMIVLGQPLHVIGISGLRVFVPTNSLYIHIRRHLQRFDALRLSRLHTLCVSSLSWIVCWFVVALCVCVWDWLGIIRMYRSGDAWMHYCMRTFQTKIAVIHIYYTRKQFTLRSAFFSLLFCALVSLVVLHVQNMNR